MREVPVNSVEVPDRLVQLCNEWHSGIGDMLYAVASTGGLTTGTMRPIGSDNYPLSDEQWYLQLWREFSSDLGYVVRLAKKAYDEYVSGDSFSGFTKVWADYVDLRDYESWIDETIIPGLEHFYGLEDWDN